MQFHNKLSFVISLILMTVSIFTISSQPQSVIAAPSLKLPYESGTDWQVEGGPGDGLHGTVQMRWAYDFKMDDNTPILAAASGTITHIEFGFTEGRRDETLLNKGNRLVILHDDNTTSALYLHLRHNGIANKPGASAPLAVGDYVQQGQHIAYSGNTGYSSGPHLHFQLQHACGIWICNSIAFNFVEYPNGLNKPTKAKSQNRLIGSDSHPPSAPSNLTAEALGPTEIRLRWEDKSNNESGFKIYGTGGTFIGQVGANEKTYLVTTHLRPSTRHCFVVRSFNTTGESGASNSACATTHAELDPLPSAPTNLQAQATGTTTVRLSWNNTSGKRTGFFIVASIHGQDDWFEIDHPDGGNLTTYEVRGLNPGINYCFAMKSRNDTGYSPGWSNTACATTHGTGVPPAAPSNLQILFDYSAEQWFLMWEDNSNNEEGFDVYAEFYYDVYQIRHLGTVGPDSWFFWIEWEDMYDEPSCFVVSAYNSSGRSEWVRTCWVEAN